MLPNKGIIYLSKINDSFKTIRIKKIYEKSTVGVIEYYLIIVIGEI